MHLPDNPVLSRLFFPFMLFIGVYKNIKLFYNIRKFNKKLNGPYGLKKHNMLIGGNMKKMNWKFGNNRRTALCHTHL